MLPRENRLKDSDRIEEIKKSSKRINTPLFTVLVDKNNVDKSLFAIIVSSKVSKNAVIRNKIKRYTREAVRKNLYHFPAADYVFIAKKNLTKFSHESILESILELVKKL